MRAGFARADITCANGTPLGGNARTDKASRGVHDQLFASVVVLDDGATTTVIIGTDLLGVSADFVAAIAGHAAAITGAHEDNVIVFATHTHSGPDTIHGSGFDDADYTRVIIWQNEAVLAIAQAIAEAFSSVIEVTVQRALTTAPGFAFHRRLRHTDGTLLMNWSDVDPDAVSPAGPVDDELTLLTFHSESGIVGALVHFTLHPAVLVGHDWLVSADYIAALSSTLRGSIGPVPVIFANGALGNINHLDYHDEGRAIGFAEAERIGHGIGEHAAHLVAAADAVEETSLWADRFVVTLTQRTVDFDHLRWARSVLRRSDAGAADALDGIPESAYARWALNRGKDLPPLLDVSVAMVGIGSTVFVFLPFEVFVEFGLELRAAFSNHIVKVVSLSGDYLGYLPTAIAFADGGYEPTFGTSRISQGQGEYLFQEISRQLSQKLISTTDRGDRE